MRIIDESAKPSQRQDSRGFARRSSSLMVEDLLDRSRKAVSGEEMGFLGDLAAKARLSGMGSLHQEDEARVFRIYKSARKMRQDLAKTKREIGGSTEIDGAIRRMDRAGDLAKTIVISENMGLIRSFAMMIRKGRPQSCLSVDDLVGFGCEELIRSSMDKFDPERGVRFFSYAGFHAQRAMRRALDNFGREIRVPTWISDATRAISSASTNQFSRTGRELSDEKIAGMQVYDIDSIRAGKARIRRTRTISAFRKIRAPDGSDAGMTLLDTLCDNSESAERIIIRREYLAKILGSLTGSESEVLARRFSFDRQGRERMEMRTLAEVGKELGLSRERVRQIEENALERLRAAARRMDLVDLSRTGLHQGTVDGSGIDILRS
jgi:RNA polymerase primary sigma factor